KSGVTIRMKVADISEQGRATQGVKLIRLDEGDEIAAITKLDDHENVIIGAVNGETVAPENGDGPVDNATEATENPSTEGDPQE
ncbi:MAG: DNA gyrase C-terminal beta-propeller domain-containing protein, partial [Chitinophagaceae bacterium]